ncbi:hypothetical protein MMC30_001784 [Trapelia coarctata]|nr:hypothetical protein [Trapelia coarctata]
MSTSIKIPKRKDRTSPSSSLFSTSSSSHTAASTPPSSDAAAPPSPYQDGRRKEKAEKRDRRVSLLSSSLSAQEHTVVNIGHPDGPPRLITCVRSSQGFDWNQEIFLPSHSFSHSHSLDPYLSPDLERKKDPVHEIVLTEDDIRAMFPQ